MTLEQSLDRLRQDAVDRGMIALATYYSWSLMRVRGERIVQSMEIKGLTDQSKGIK